MFGLGILARSPFLRGKCTNLTRNTFSFWPWSNPSRELSMTTSKPHWQRNDEYYLLYGSSAISVRYTKAESMQCRYAHNSAQKPEMETSDGSTKSRIFQG